MIKRSLWILALTAALVACSSGVKLSEVPVEDKNASAASASSSDAAQSSVAAVVGGKAGAQGVAPAGVNVVYFDYDSFTLKPEARAVLERNAAHLQSNKQFKVQLEGHTDDRGGREYNLALGQKRAETVRRALTLLGVSDAQLEAVSFGKEKPAAAGADEATYAKNRRVEIKY
ncbi:MAG: peptidoglycan-associated lipoprotein Pal [Betaproteobacteria bacterium]|jgi:peptidoglycan-associated lipoprotein